MDFQQREENNYPKAFLATGIIVALFALLCYYIVVFTSVPPPEMGTGGILVNYGTSDQGMGSDYMSTEEPSVAEKANHTRPTKVTQAPPTPQKSQEDLSDKKVVTQNTEDAPEVNANSKVSSKAVATQPVSKPAKPTVNQNALYKGKSNGGTGEGDGNTNTPGNQGKPTGSTLANNYNGTGSGNGGNLAMDQRSFRIPPKVNDSHQVEGKIVIQIEVDKQGNVTRAAAARGTMISDDNLVEKCRRACLNAKLNQLESAQDTQIGFVTFVFKLQ